MDSKNDCRTRQVRGRCWVDQDASLTHVNVLSPVALMSDIVTSILLQNTEEMNRHPQLSFMPCARGYRDLPYLSLNFRFRRVF
ncbi:polyketide synthase [Moniliophthora roreri]|nr:polyketide synthase [Moniliophthora roreri]